MHLRINSAFDISVCRHHAFLRLPFLGATFIEWQGFGPTPGPWLERQRTNEGERLIWAGPLHLIHTPAALL